ncbi:MAG: glycogen debranching enzyme N-terminal domain-containing protein, partial [Acidobacteriaceae bacterium]|nr:glycogen debranching enzyme N-terminal domain-containing protein [Acidobacteriaceae bacterium]
MNNIFTHDPNTPLTDEDFKTLTETEWLVTNGLGGYASGTVGGTLTRVFHGYLISALQSPLGRTMMLNDLLEEFVMPDGRRLRLNGLMTEGGEYRGASPYLTSFALDWGLPVWTYDVEGLIFEKRVILPHRQNTSYIDYRFLNGKAAVKLQLRPAVNMRPHESPVNTKLDSYTFTVRDHHYELQPSGAIPPLRLMLLGKGGSVTVDPQRIRNVTYELERSRGYIWRGDL